METGNFGCIVTAGIVYVLCSTEGSILTMKWFSQKKKVNTEIQEKG